MAGSAGHKPVGKVQPHTVPGSTLNPGIAAYVHLHMTLGAAAGIDYPQITRLDLRGKNLCKIACTCIVGCGFGGERQTQ